MEFTESRFPHLLQPIRELTKNWEIDVASELNDYLEELDNMCITFDGGKTRLNFAEAALLIQGSACIYSKKVELLHSLVYQTLEYINDRNKKRSKQASSQEDDAAGEHDADDAAVFTPLNIDVSGNPMKADSNTTVSVAPLPPESLIPLETTEKYKLPLISMAGDVLCSQKDFRINLFVPGAQDVILLSLGSSCRLLLHPADPLLLHPADPLLLHPADPLLLHPADPLLLNPADPLLLHPADPLRGDEAPVAREDHFLPLEDMDLDLDLEEHVDRHQALSEGRMTRERRRGEEPRTQQPAEDAWWSHDPYCVLAGDAPFRAGRCHKVPAGLDEGGKRKRRRAASLQDFSSWFRRTFDPPEHKLKNGPASPDLNYIYVSTMKNKLRTQKRINRRVGVAVSDEELRRTFLQPEEAGPHQQGEEPVDGFRPPDLLGGDDNSDNEQEAFPDFISAGAERDELSYEDLVKLRVEQLVVTSRGFTQETALSRRVKDWEDKIRPELVLQEQRSVFDIHDYGDRIVSALNGVGQRKSFCSIVSGLNNYEACKYLLASLQLANDLTVELDSAGRLEDSVDTMGLKLLNTLRATDRFKTLPGST